MVTGPFRKPTPAEYLVIFFLIVAWLLGMGIVALVAASRASPEKHDLAVQLVRLGISCLGLGIGSIAGYWIYRRCKDYDR
jgi:hypothetical protein